MERKVGGNQWKPPLPEVIEYSRDEVIPVRIQIRPTS